MEDRPLLTGFRATLVRVPLLHLAFSLLLFTAVFAVVDLVTGIGHPLVLGLIVGGFAFASSRRGMRRGG